MARLLSDGVCNAYLVDVWTHSAYRRRGIASTLIRMLADAVPGQHIGLQTDDAQELLPLARLPAAAGVLVARLGPLARQRREPVSTCPKIELHVHLEGTVRPDTLRAIAKRNDYALPDDLESLFHFRDFAHFIEVFELVATALQHYDDFREVVVAYAEEAAAHGAVYSRASSSPGLWRGLDTDAVFSGYCDGAAEARELHGVEVRLTPDIPRGLFAGGRARRPPSYAVELPRPRRRRHRHRRPGGGYPPEPFARGVRARARGRARLGAARRRGRRRGRRCAARSRRFSADRIRHGIRAVEDPRPRRASSPAAAPSSTSARSRTSAPASSRSLEEHPLPQLVAAGVQCSISTDDPAMFDTDLTRDYEAAASLGLSPRAAYEAGVAGALCDDATRERLRSIGGALRLGSLDFPGHGDCERSGARRLLQRGARGRARPRGPARHLPQHAHHARRRGARPHPLPPGQDPRLVLHRPRQRSRRRRRRDGDGAGRRRHAAPPRHGRPHHARRRAVADLRAVHGTPGRPDARPRRQRPHGRPAARADRDGQPPPRDASGRGRLRARLPHSGGVARRGRLVRRRSLRARRRARVDDARRHPPAPDGLRLRQQPVRLLHADAVRVRDRARRRPRAGVRLRGSRRRRHRRPRRLPRGEARDREGARRRRARRSSSA